MNKPTIGSVLGLTVCFMSAGCQTVDTEPFSYEMTETPPPRDQLYRPKGDPADETHAWPVHDYDRPLPRVVEPGTASRQARAGRAPSDAIVLFDGNDPDANLDAWVFTKEGSKGWLVKDGYIEIVPGEGSMQTLERFGDCQIHLEWQVPLSQQGKFGQSRGNSGIYIMRRYEVQIGDHRDNGTYADGMAGAVYGQSPPLVNPGLGLDRWQTYDIIFRRPLFDSEGNLTRPAVVTVLHNGVLVQDHWHLEGPTNYEKRKPYRAHGEKDAFFLQDHKCTVRFRNIWVRPLAERPVSPMESPR